MKNYILALFMALVFGVSPSASAAAYCSGTISHTLTYASGEVMIWGSWRGTWTSICNVKQEWGGIPPEVCFAWFSVVNSAITDNKAVTVYYIGIEPTECSTMDAMGGAPVPGFVQFTK